jgi:hypothetical protein
MTMLQIMFSADNIIFKYRNIDIIETVHRENCYDVTLTRLQSKYPKNYICWNIKIMLKLSLTIFKHICGLAKIIKLLFNNFSQ